MLLAAQFARVRREPREQLLGHIAHPAQLAGLVVEQLRVQSLARGSPAVLIEDLRGRVACLDALASALGSRLTLGLAMFPHGAQKTLGWFGGYGFSGTMNFFTGQLHIPTLLAFLAIAAEFAGSIGLITGFFSRVAAYSPY